MRRPRDAPVESGHEPSRKADSVSGLPYYIDCYLIAQYYKYGKQITNVKHYL